MCIDSYADISIHTPTRGTTAGTGTATNLAEFQSTFPREERPYYTIVRIQVLQFQSTLPREERRKADRCTSGSNGISIHAPTRGATISNVDFKSIPYISIHAPTRGATVTFVPLIVANCIFQSTLPREERLCMFRHATPYPHFNPRSHERSDHYGVISLVEFFISIHAPTRGATR